MSSVRGRDSTHRCGQRWRHSISEPSCVGTALQGLRRLVVVLRLHKTAQQHLPQLQAGHVVAVAAENDVGAPARHVGGDGHGASPTSLGHDLRFALHFSGLALSRLWGISSSASSELSSSLFSTEVVPTSTSRPFL